MPWRDWQFWAVTLAMAGAAWLAIRAVVPKRRPGKRTSLTVEGRKPKRDPRVN